MKPEEAVERGALWYEHPDKHYEISRHVTCIE
jgi:hypothetical protein